MRLGHVCLYPHLLEGQRGEGVKEVMTRLRGCGVRVKKTTYREPADGITKPDRGEMVVYSFRHRQEGVTTF